MPDVFCGETNNKKINKNYSVLNYRGSPLYSITGKVKKKSYLNLLKKI